MADFCKQCSLELFGEDFGDLKNLKPEPAPYWITYTVRVICEGCGATVVNQDGVCISGSCLKKHGANKNEREN